MGRPIRLSEKDFKKLDKKTREKIDLDPVKIYAKLNEINRRLINIWGYLLKERLSGETTVKERNKAAKVSQNAKKAG